MAPRPAFGADARSSPVASPFLADSHTRPGITSHVVPCWTDATKQGRAMAELRHGDSLEYLSPNECAVILSHREADALLAVLEKALGDGVTPGPGLWAKDAESAGFKIVSERWRDQDPYSRGMRIVATVARKPPADGRDET